MIKKLFIVPYFGSFPSWMDSYLKNVESLRQYGYDWLVMTDLNDFTSRIKNVLGIETLVAPGTSKPHNFRTAYGLMFQDELQGYDFWGITDLDCVYGNIPHFVPDNMLAELDIQSNHFEYICGPWTLFRNVGRVNNLFKDVAQWAGHMTAENDHPGRWTEQEYSRAVEASGVRYKYTHFQGKDPNIDENVHFKGNELYDGDTEIMMFHCNRKKRWPPNAKI